MQNERRILVTGASGFIGKHLVKRLREEKYEVVESKVRIENEDEVFLLPMSDLVIHLAASVGVPASWDNPQETMSVNIAGTLNVLKYCVKNRADILYAGSYFYGNPKTLPTKEDDPISLESPYSISKFAGEELCFAYASKYNLNAISFRVFNPYGPGQSDKMIVSQMISELVNQGRITILDGRPRRDFLYIDDLIDAYAKGIHNLEGSREIYNVGYGENWSIAEIAQILATIHGGAEIIDKKVVRSNEIMETCADISKIKNNLGWQPTVRIEEGLAKTYEWYAKKNKERS